MGGALPNGAARRIRASITGAPGDDLVLFSDNGEFARLTIDSAEFVSETPIPQDARYVRGEIQARASHKRLLESVYKAFSAKRPPKSLNRESIVPAKLRRALSNPVYFGSWDSPAA